MINSKKLDSRLLPSMHPIETSDLSEDTHVQSAIKVWENWTGFGGPRDIGTEKYQLGQRNTNWDIE